MLPSPDQIEQRLVELSVATNHVRLRVQRWLTQEVLDLRTQRNHQLDRPAQRVDDRALIQPRIGVGGFDQVHRLQCQGDQQGLSVREP